MAENDEFGKKIGAIVRERKEREEGSRQKQAEAQAAMQKFQKDWQQVTSPKIMQWLYEIQQSLAAQEVQAQVGSGGAGTCAIQIPARSRGGRDAKLQITPNFASGEVRIDRHGHWRNVNPDQITKSMLETEVVTLVQDMF